MRTIHLLATAALLFSTCASAQIYKCIEKGKTTYSESPCKGNDYQSNRFEVVDDRVGTVSPDRATINATRARIQAEMNPAPAAAGTTRTTVTTTTTTRSNTPTRDYQCDGLAREIADIDSSARQARDRWWQDHLRERKRNAQQKQNDLKC